MSDEEDDYMSAAVLGACGDTRPGLFKTKKEENRRKAELKAQEFRRKNYVKPLKVRELEHRNEGLNKQLDSSNKGFALMQKMGYKPGTAIGKAGTGRVEPISVEVKSNREGLGKSAQKRENAEMLEMRREREHAKKLRAAHAMQLNYRGMKAAEHKYKQVKKYLVQSQKVCEQLDSQNNITEPVNVDFWPKQIPPITDEDEDEETELAEELDEETQYIKDMESLRGVTEYLRTSYLYCVWCGYSYDDVGSLSTQCPGNTAESHDE